MNDAVSRLCIRAQNEATSIALSQICRDKNRTITELRTQLANAERKLLDQEGLVCANCLDTGWLENREEGRHPCTCMTEAEPYQLLQAK